MGRAAWDFRGNIASKRYEVDANGEIKEVPISTYVQTNGNAPGALTTQVDAAKASIKEAEQRSYSDAILKSQQIKTQKLQETYEARLAEVTSRENTYNTIADQIAGLARNTSGLGALPSLNPQPVPPAAAQGATLPTFGLGGGAPARPTTATSKDYIGDAVKIVTEYAEKINKATADKKTDEVKKLIDERNKNIQDLASDYVKTTQAPTAASTPPTAQQVAANITGAVGSLSAFNNYGASDLSSRLNFQVSNQQILDDYNTAYAGRLSRIVEQGSAQIAGIQERLNAATKLLAGLPANDARRKTSDQYISELRKDLTSVQGAVSQAIQTQKNFKPLALSDPKAQTQITQFREYLKLPEERSLDQIRQIDPATFSAAQSLTNQYQNLMGQTYESTLDPATQAARRATQDAFLRRANEDYGSSVDPNTLAFRRQVERQIQDKVGENIPSFLNAQTEALRGTLEDDTLNQLRLGSLLDSDLQRQYQQAARAAQTARGNIFGVAPAVEEAVQTGMAGEARKAQRQAAAQSFLQSGQTRSDATALDRQLIEATRRNRLGDAASFFSSGQSAEDVLSRDRQLRDTMNRARGMDLANYLASGATAEDAVRLDLNFRNQQRLNNLGAAGNFLAAGPSLYNLANARTTGQQAAFQNYINANQANPGQFNPQANQVPFYQTTSPNIPVDLTQTAASIYNTMQNAQASMYGSQVGAIANTYTSPFQAFSQVAGGIGSLLSPFKFS